MRVKCKFGQESQKGFSLVTTLFIIVVLAVLGGYMVSMTITQTQSSALAVQGLRAWYAGVSGFEWAAYEINSSGNCPTIPATMNIEGFNVNITSCTEYSIFEAGNNFKLHDVTVLSERGSYGDVDFVSRTIRATIGGI